ncbi:hypothetical protein PC9H_003441 [Pleurotus ostreatus]|uniref:DNA replication regulator SLD2 n=2 Tax=Pleurotus TaxID=5320 RepID=A0A8H6ZZ34_PLEOS|nr:uncharacterized protein PC9H_003441 [Pleurotus ostreatus]KAF7436608.1 hypothetical protein PC9H_003441 [Pleurotus ostreatus]KAG9222609.1 hypothetical protein CCMSSC00406_0004523 [Pleurotus cornucopiae]
MPADIATVRTEIKEWERYFKETNGRDASIDDIKELPHIAEKYKLYKRLRKAESQASQPVKASTSRSSPPSTPPRGKPRDLSSLEAPLLVHSRHAETTAPLTSFNPFSPRKKKQKPKEHVPTPPQRSDASKPRPNPFATPVKGKGRSTAEPYPMINPLALPEQQPAPNTAITRARKRLRGEPVSPSPNKPKRRRANPEAQTLLSFKPLEHPSMSHGTKRLSVSDDEESDAEQVGSLSFVGESPVKQPSGGKSFKLLFEDMAPLRLDTKGKGKAASKNTDIFSDLPKLNASTKPTNTNTKSNKLTFMEPSHPLKAGPSKPGEQASKGNARKKRRLSVSDDHSGHDSKGESDNGPNSSDVNGTQHAVKLIPPSPPPADPYAPKRYKQNAKSGKDKAVTNNRKKSKKSKTDDNESSDGSDEWDTLESQIRIVNRRAVAQQRTGDNVDTAMERDIEDPILALPRHVDTLPEEVADEPVDQSTTLLSTPLAKLAGLSINSAYPSKDRGPNEGQLVRGLLYGRPAKGRLYDPRRGGEIWGVGEGDEGDEDGEDDLLGLGSKTGVDRGRHGLKSKAGAVTEEDDDWEGEPVPWEVGEL